VLSQLCHWRRSGNRGECAQPCRKIYSLVDESGNFIIKDKYLLSLKDLNLSGYIRELVDAGINSFKIEGRLKDINYVKNIVSFYRQKIDGAGYKKTSSGNISIDFTPDPEKTFNRAIRIIFLRDAVKI
jgi:putative protease